MSIDHPSICPWPAPDWRGLLRHGDVVRFQFPVSEASADGKLEPLPCLVLDVVKKGSRRYALLAYGTTERVHSGRGYETHVSRRRELRAAGLDDPTRFVGSRRILVPLEHPGFVIGNNGTPLIGRLTGSAAERMHAVRTRIIAEHDLAVSRRKKRRAPTPSPGTSLLTIEAAPAGFEARSKAR